MRRLVWWLALLAIAVGAHEATIYATPDVLMSGVMKRLSRSEGWNHMLHAARATEQQRVVVMPSPDLLYSICPYDLAKGPLRFTAPLPADTPWSLSAYDAHTDNYFVVDDQTLGAQQADVVFTAAGQAFAARPGERVVQSPTTHGLLLVRTVISKEARASELDAIRRKAECSTITAGPSTERASPGS